MDNLLMRVVPFFSMTVIFTTASEPSSFRFSATLSMISLGVGPAFALGIPPERPKPKALMSAQVAIRREMGVRFMVDSSPLVGRSWPPVLRAWTGRSSRSKSESLGSIESEQHVQAQEVRGGIVGARVHHWRRLRAARLLLEDLAFGLAHVHGQLVPKRIRQRDLELAQEQGATDGCAHVLTGGEVDIGESGTGDGRFVAEPAAQGQLVFDDPNVAAELQGEAVLPALLNHYIADRDGVDLVARRIVQRAEEAVRIQHEVLDA